MPFSGDRSERRPPAPRDKTPHHVGVGEAVLADELDGDDAAELLVARLEDLAHAALAQPFQHDVGAKHQAGGAARKIWLT